MRIIFIILLAVATALAGLRSAPAHAYVYFTESSLLASFFPAAATETVDWAPTPEEVARFRARVGYAPPSRSYRWHVAGEGGVPTAFALVDEQLGQHEPITFGVLLNPDATIERIEIMVYREAYGDGVRAAGFRTQFHGLQFENRMRPGKEIRIVSGATVSTRALATGARRASALLATWLGQ